jgi:predicted type IV restriction endonuclease
LVKAVPRDGIVVHRRKELNTTTHQGIPTTTPAETLIDLSSTWPQNRLEAAIAVADNLDLIRPDRLRKAAEKAGRRGAKLRRLLDRQTFRLTESELERYFLAIVRRTATQQTRDREKDQALTVRGLTVLRFTHAQVIYEPDHVARTLAAVAGY